MNALLLAAFAATNIVAELPPVTVYASRTDMKAWRKPGPVRVLDAETIGRSRARCLTDLLERKTDVGIRAVNGNPLQTQIAMRGFGENSFGRVKVLLDGEELNNVDMSVPNLAGFAFGSVGRVEILHGPSPVLHGDGAVAGVVNVLTEECPCEKPETRLSASVGSYGSAGASVLTRGGAGEDGVAYSAAYEYVRSDGYRDRSAYDIHAFDASLRKVFENESYIRIKADYGDAFYEMPGAISREEWKADARAARYGHDWCRVWNFGFGPSVKAKIAEDQWLCLDGRFSMRHRHSNWGDYHYANDYELSRISLSPRYVNEVPFGGFENRFTAGMDFSFDHYAVEDRSGFNNPQYDFGRLRNAAFVHDEFALTEEFSFTAGIRVENIDSRWSRYRGIGQSNGNDWAVDFESGVVWRPADGLKTYAKGTHFHRSPFCDEMNYTRDGRLLEPERGFSLDAGVEWKIAGEFDFAANAYSMIVDDEIFYNPYVTPGAYGWNGFNCNSPSRTRRIGFDTGISWCREKKAEASVSYGAVHADFGEGQFHGCDVPLVPNHRVRAEVGVWIGDDFEVKGGCRFTGSQRLLGDFANEHEKLKGRTLFYLGFYYEPSWAEGWSASLVVDNLFDRDYCDFAGWSDWSGAYYYPAAARSFLASVAYTF